MTRRGLTPDEIDLWNRVAARTERLHVQRGILPTKPLPKPKPANSPLPRMDGFGVVQPDKARPWSHDLKPTLVGHLPGGPVQMDKKAFGRMKRGKMKPEARIDLHGLTLDRAHPALIRFILTAHGSGKRLVLVITGKGKSSDQPGPIPMRHGVLKTQVPHWLSIPPLAQAVLQISPAHISHGDTGALYVYLRRGH